MVEGQTGPPAIGATTGTATVLIAFCTANIPAKRAYSLSGPAPVAEKCTGALLIVLLVISDSEPTPQTT